MTQWLNQNTRVRLRISFLVQITFHSKTYKAQIRHDPVNLSKYLCTYTKGISIENINSHGLLKTTLMTLTVSDHGVIYNHRKRLPLHKASYKLFCHDLISPNIILTRSTKIAHVTQSHKLS